MTALVPDALTDRPRMRGEKTCCVKKGAHVRRLPTGLPDTPPDRLTDLQVRQFLLGVTRDKKGNPN